MDHANLAILTGDVQRRGPVLHCRVLVAAGSDQAIDHVNVAIMTSDVH